MSETGWGLSDCPTRPLVALPALLRRGRDSWSRAGPAPVPGLHNPIPLKQRLPVAQTLVQMRALRVSDSCHHFGPPSGLRTPLWSSSGAAPPRMFPRYTGVVAHEDAVRVNTERHRAAVHELAPQCLQVVLRRGEHEPGCGRGRKAIRLLKSDALCLARGNNKSNHTEIRMTIERTQFHANNPAPRRWRVADRWRRCARASCPRGPRGMSPPKSTWLVGWRPLRPLQGSDSGRAWDRAHDPLGVRAATDGRTSRVASAVEALKSETRCAMSFYTPLSRMEKVHAPNFTHGLARPGPASSKASIMSCDRSQIRPETSPRSRQLDERLLGHNRIAAMARAHEHPNSSASEAWSGASGPMLADVQSLLPQLGPWLSDTGCVSHRLRRAAASHESCFSRCTPVLWARPGDAKVTSPGQHRPGITQSRRGVLTLGRTKTQLMGNSAPEAFPRDYRIHCVGDVPAR